MTEKTYENSVLNRTNKIIDKYDFEELKKHGYSREIKKYGFATIFPPLKAMSKIELNKRDLLFKKDIAYELYIHHPFCTGKCTYCHFNVINSDKSLQKKYHEALKKELKSIFSQKIKPRINSIYFGGGSPSLIETDLLEEIFSLLRSLGLSIDDCKKTIELHPEVIHQRDLSEYFKQLRSLGFTNVSVGVQDFNRDVLLKINRRHSKNDAIKVISLAKKNGFRVNVDLLINLPNQTIKKLIFSLKTAFSLSLDQVSVYMTVLRPHMKMYWQYVKKTENFPGEELMMKMYAMAQLVAADFAYEENYPNLFFKKIEDSKKNKLGFYPLLKALLFKLKLVMNRNISRKTETKEIESNLIAVGAGVYSFINGIQFFNHPNINKYIDLINEKGNAAWRGTKLTKDLKFLREIIFGIKYGYFDRKKYLMLSNPLKKELNKAVEEYTDLNLIENNFNDSDKVLLTSKGKLFSDEMIKKIIPSSLIDTISRNNIGGEKDIVEANNFFYELN